MLFLVLTFVFSIVSFCQSDSLYNKECKGYPIVFTNLENATINGKHIQGNSSKRAKFNSENVLNSEEDGWICFSNTKSGRKAIGFAYQKKKKRRNLQVDYGFQFPNYSNTVRLIESGWMGSSIKISPEDIFRVERKGNIILYFRNDEKIKEVKTDNTKSLIVGGWLKNKAAFFEEIVINFDSDKDIFVCDEYDVVYTNLTDISITGTTIQHQQGSSLFGTFESVNTIPANQDGYMCFKVVNVHQDVVKTIGLSFENTNNSGSPIDYAFQFKGRTLQGNGITVGSFNVVIGDILKIEKTGNTINYYQNQVLLQTISIPLNNQGEAFILDGYLYNSAFFEDVKMSHVSKRGCKLSILPSTDISLCESDQVQLQVSGANYYKWIPATGLSCNNCPNPILSENYGSISSAYSLFGFYSLEELESNSYCDENNIIINIITDCPEEIIGCCFSNYGAAVTTLPNSYINIHCNLLNEVGMTAGVLQKGEFKNEGQIRVEYNWINNGYNSLFITQGGTSELFGNYQQMRGHSSTHFYNLSLTGNDKKEIKIDEYTHGVLNLTDRELVIGDYTFFVENNSAGAIQQTTGFASTDGIGYLSRVVIGGTDYHYPMGSTIGTFRVRPIELYNASIDGKYKVGYFNHDPAIDGLIAIAPNVLSLNNLYYHRILSPLPQLDIGVRGFFNKPIEGDFQSIAHWETITSAGNLTPPYWESTPVATFYPSGGSGLDFLESYGTFSFEGEPFVLAQAGFYVNTGDFGTTGSANMGGAGTTIAINGPTASGGNGGGTGQVNGTGGTTTVAPSPLIGDYEIDIETGGDSQPGGITFTVGSDGIIDETSVEYEDETTGESGELSSDLYDVDPITNGITLHDTPPDLDFDCTSSVVIKMGNTNPFVLSAGESILISGISITEISGLNFKLFDKGSNVIAILPYSFGNNFSITPVNTLSPGAYHFEMELSLSSGGVERINGQFIAN